MPRVSVIIPNFNHEKFLANRIETVLAQSFDDIEVLFLDDASTDGSLAVWEQYAADPRMQLICNDQNSGSPFKQWNKGVAAARGEYIWIAESDDYADPVLLQRLLQIMEYEKTVGLAFCQSWLADEHDQVIQRYDDYDRSVSGARWQDGFVNDGMDELRNHLISKNTVPNASAVLFKREIYQHIGGAPEHLRLCGDWMTWARMLMHCDIAFHPEPLNYFRVSHAVSQRTQAKSEALDVFEGMEVFKTIASSVEPSPSEYGKAFYDHVSRWAMYAIAFRYSFRLNKAIYMGFSKLKCDSGVVFSCRVSGLFLQRMVAAVVQVLKK